MNPIKITYDWQGWHVALWQADSGWEWVAYKGQRMVEGDATGSLAQVKLLLAAELNRRKGIEPDLEEIT